MNENINVNQTFSNFLKEKRTALGMSLRKFSTHIYGTDKKFMQLHNIETGKKTTKLNTMNFILDKLNCRFCIEEL